jgi:sulfur-oxidizing protein SoxA
VAGRSILSSGSIYAGPIAGSHTIAFREQRAAGTAYVANQSRGLPIRIAHDPQTRPHIDAGREVFARRQGQLNLFCAQCHDDNWGQRLAGVPIPQAHPSGYPLYRLEWQGIGSLRRRLRNCLVGMRAEPYPSDAPEIVDLELYLAWRANGLPIETPAVRP